MKFLLITTPAGVKTFYTENYVSKVVTAADVPDAGSPYSAPQVRTRGLITEVHYQEAAAAAAAAAPVTVVVAAIPAYNGANNKYEIGCLTDDGAFKAILANYRLA